MSYVRVNGRRCYKDDQTGLVYLDEDGPASRIPIDIQQYEQPSISKGKKICIALLIAALYSGLIFGYLNPSPQQGSIMQYFEAAESENR